MLAQKVSRPKRAAGAKPVAPSRPPAAQRPQEHAGSGPVWNLADLSTDAPTGRTGDAPKPHAVMRAVGRPSDPSERDADRMASRVLRMPAPETAPRPASTHAAASRKEQDQTESVAGTSPHDPVSRVLRSPGHPLDASTRSFMEPRFGHDFSRIRVHTSGEAANASRHLNARAFTSGQDIVFAPGEYNPQTSNGRHLLAHELAHVAQGACGSADNVIRRREVGSEAAIKGPKDWIESDREDDTRRWREACWSILHDVDAEQFVKVAERRDFYKWFYKFATAQHYTTRWALAAYIVASGAEQVVDMDRGLGVGRWGNSALTFANVELQGAMREGNQIIFDNVLPKLKKLIDGGALTGQAALKWDMQILAEEQNLVQPMYNRLNPDTVKQLDFIARKSGWVIPTSTLFTGDDVVRDSPNVKGGTIPGFDQHNIRDVGDRWTYGMQLGNKFTPGGTGFDPAQHRMPGVSAGYQDGTELARVDTHFHLHELDAWLNPDRVDRVGPGSDEKAIIAHLTEPEKRQILNDRSADGWAYSKQFGQFSFIDEKTVRNALPTDPASAPAVNAFVARFKDEQQWVAGRGGSQEM